MPGKIRPTAATTAFALVARRAVFAIPVEDQTAVPAHKK